MIDRKLIEKSVEKGTCFRLQDCEDCPVYLIRKLGNFTDKWICGTKDGDGYRSIVNGLRPRAIRILKEWLDEQDESKTALEIIMINGKPTECKVTRIGAPIHDGKFFIPLPEGLQIADEAKEPPEKELSQEEKKDFNKKVIDKWFDVWTGESVSGFHYFYDHLDEILKELKR